MRTRSSGLLVSITGLCCLAVASQSPPATVGAQQPKEQKKAADRIVKLPRYFIVEILAEVIEVDPNLFPNNNLGSVLSWLQKTIETKWDAKLPIFVDTNAFKDENPDAPDVTETIVKMPVLVKHMTIADLLETALGQVATKNATFLVRNGKLEITTTDNARPQALLAAKVSAQFYKKNLRNALDDLADQTGMSIVIDPRIGEKVSTPVTAAFVNNASLEAAVTVLSNMVGVESILLRDVLYITTPENAQKLRSVQQQLKETPKKKTSAPPSGA